MIDEHFRYVGGEIVAYEGDQGWIFWNSCLCQMDFTEKKAHILHRFEYRFEDYSNSFSNIVKIDRKLYLLPGYKNLNIGVFDLDSNELKTIPLAEFEDKYQARENIFFKWHIEYKGYLYLLGYYYPAIVKLNLADDSITYISDWAEEADKSQKPNNWYGYLAEGYDIRQDKIYIPIGCMKGILELDTLTDTTRIIPIETEAEAIGGLTRIDDDYYVLVGRGVKSGRVIKWDTRSEQTVMETKIEELEDPFENALSPVIPVNGRIYTLPLLTLEKSHSYLYEAETGDVIIDETLSEYIDEVGLFREKQFVPYAAMGKYLKDGHTIRYNSGKDYRWIEYDTDTGKVEEFYIACEAEEDLLYSLYGQTVRANTDTNTTNNTYRVPLESFLDVIETYEK